MKPSLLLLATAFFTVLSASGFAANSSVIVSPLTRTGVDPDAGGRVISSLSVASSSFFVGVSKLAPSARYEVEIGGIVEGVLVTNRTGAGTLVFRGPAAGRLPALDFDPRGQRVRVLSGGSSVLEATLSAAGEPAGAVVVERVNLARTAVTSATGSARADFRLEAHGRRTLAVELERAGTGPFQLLVGGVNRGTFTPVGILAKIKFSSSSDDAGTLPLDFDPRGQLLEVVRSGVVIFSGTLAARALGVNLALPRLATVAIRSTGADPDGHAEAKLRLDERARKHFSVEIEDVPVGSYDLLVNGVDVADLVVTARVGGGTQGEVEFTNGDDDPDELPLTFDPAGKTLAIRQGATVFFQGAFVPSTDNGAGRPGPEAPSELEESLTSTGLDGDASGRVRYRVEAGGRHRFHVEIEDVPAGNYTLRVAGIVRGTIRVLATAGGVEGELEFDTKIEPGHVPLTFDPRGQQLEIFSAAGPFFSHLFGGS